MKHRVTPMWILWGVSLAAMAAAAILMPVPRNACYYVTLLAIVSGLILSACVLVKLGREPDAVSGIGTLPLHQVVMGIMVMQLIVGVGLLALSGVCPWIVAALVACLFLTVDAFALVPGNAPAQSEDKPE